MVAGALDAMRLGKHEECKARLFLTLAAIDQTSCGSRKLAACCRGKPGTGSALPQLCKSSSARRFRDASLGPLGPQMVRAIHGSTEGRDGLPGAKVEARPSCGEGRRSCPKGRCSAKENCEGRREGKREAQGQREATACRGNSILTKTLLEPLREGTSATNCRSLEGSDPHLHVPGERASPVEANALWCALPRWVLVSRTPLSAFIKSFLCNKLQVPCGTTFDLWPMAVPFPECFRRCSWKMDRKTISHKQSVNLMILVLSWLHLGQPSKCPTPLSTSTKLSKAQWKVVRRLEDHAEDLLAVGTVGPVEMGRGAAKVESLENLISKLHVAAKEIFVDGYQGKHENEAAHLQGPEPTDVESEVVGRMSSGAPVVAKSIEPHRLSLPTAPPSFDPTPLLPKLHRKVFLDPVA